MLVSRNFSGKCYWGSKVSICCIHILFVCTGSCNYWFKRQVCRLTGHIVFVSSWYFSFINAITEPWNGILLSFILAFMLVAPFQHGGISRCSFLLLPPQGSCDRTEHVRKSEPKGVFCRLLQVIVSVLLYQFSTCLVYLFMNHLHLFLDFFFVLILSLAHSQRNRNRE